MIAKLLSFTRTARLIACCCAIALLIPSLVIPSLAIADDFFISTQADFDTYRQASFDPGDQILFERGSVFNGMFEPSVVGLPSNRIRISAFGTGPRPVIHNNGVIHPHPTRSGQTISAGVFLYNPEYVEVEGLEITNNNGGDQDGENLFGIYVLSEDFVLALSSDILSTSSCMLGDMDLSGVVDFSDIPAFITLLINGTSQCEADCDENGVVDFSDIPAFIDILIGL